MTHRIVVIGASGAGKSYLCKKLTGDETIEVSDESYSCTQCVKLHTGTGPDGAQYSVLDTPGFADFSPGLTPEAAADRREDIFRAITRELQTGGGLVLYLFNVGGGRMSQQIATHHKAHLKALSKLGVSASDIVLVLTHIPYNKLRAPTEEYDGWIVKQAVDIQLLVLGKGKGEEFKPRFAKVVGLTDLPPEVATNAGIDKFLKELPALRATYALPPGACIAWADLENRLVNVASVHEKLVQKRERLKQLRAKLAQSDRWLGAAGVAAGIDIITLFPGVITGTCLVVGGMMKMITQPQAQTEESAVAELDKELARLIDSKEDIPESEEQMKKYIADIKALLQF